MRSLNSIAFRNLWSRKLRTLVTGFGIVLGVATVLAFGITNATIENSLAALTALIISQLAALYPAWRAGVMRIIEVIQHE